MKRNNRLCDYCLTSVVSHASLVTYPFGQQFTLYSSYDWHAIPPHGQEISGYTAPLWSLSVTSLVM